MTVGFQSIGDYGSIQVGTDYKNYTLVSSGQLNLSPSGAVNGLWIATLSITGTAPTVSFSRLRVHIHKVERSGNTWKYTFLGNTSPELENPSSFNYYVFDVGYGQSPSNFGLQLFSGSGELTFDSASVAFPNVLDVRTENTTGSSVTITYPVGSVTSVVQSQMGWQIVPVAGGGLEYYIILAQASGNVVTFYKRLWYTGTNANPNDKFSPYYTNVPAKFIVVDVSSII